MTLRVDVSKVENYEEKSYVEIDGTINYSPLYQVLSLLSPVIGFSEITEKNWKSIFLRFHAWERVGGPLRSDDSYITPEEVKSFIGMRVNVVPITDAVFRKSLFAYAMDEGNRKIREFENA